MFIERPIATTAEAKKKKKNQKNQGFRIYEENSFKKGKIVSNF